LFVNPKTCVFDPQKPQNVLLAWEKDGFRTRAAKCGFLWTEREMEILSVLSQSNLWSTCEVNSGTDCFQEMYFLHFFAYIKFC